MKRQIVFELFVIITLFIITACTYEGEGKHDFTLGINGRANEESQNNNPNAGNIPLEMSDDLNKESQDLNEKWDSLNRFEENGLFGFKNENDVIIVEPQYRNAHNFSEGLAFVVGVEGRENQTGFIDLTGNLVIPLLEAKSAHIFSEGFAAVIIREWDWTNEDPSMTETLGPYIFIDKTGQNVFNREFERVTNFSEGFARVALYRGNDFFIDRTGQNAFGNMEFLIAGDFWDGYANVKLLDGTYTHINREGNIVDIDRPWGQFIWEDGVMFPATSLCQIP